MPPHTTRTWEVTLPLPHWILNFFHVEEGLIIHIEVSIAAHGTEDQLNYFGIEIFFRRYLATDSPREFEESHLCFGYLWPNPDYLEEGQEPACTPSHISLATG